MCIELTTEQADQVRDFAIASHATVEDVITQCISDFIVVSLPPRLEEIKQEDAPICADPLEDVLEFPVQTAIDNNLAVASA